MKEKISEEFLIKVRKYATRISSMAFDEEIQMLIESCRNDLLLAGILEKKVKDEEDPLITNAIFNYIKAEYGLDNKDSDKYRNVYYDLRLKMSMSETYTKENQS